MALDFKRPAGMGQTAVSPQTKAEVAVVEKYDIVEDRERLSKELANSQELDDVVSTIQVYELESIVTFGAEAADEVSKASDVVLNSMNMDQLNDSGQMLTTLTKIMDKFDIDEIREDPGFFGKLFGGVQKQLDKILAKYHTMGDEVDKIYVQLKQYESEIKQ